MTDELGFKGNDPGAVKYGNFINYYQFNSFDGRLDLLPRDLWNVSSDQSFTCLDIGCNSGDLTQGLYKFISRNMSIITPSVTNSEERVKGKSGCHILGIDLDPVLISRAEETNENTSNVTYKCVNYMTDGDNTISSYLEEHNKDYFDVIFCFSITMWIHLNYGDEGLKKFLVTISRQTNMIIIEPQPWKCYRSAVRRMKRSGGIFSEFSNLKMREGVTVDIENILLNECNFIKIGKECVFTSWGRPLLFYKRSA